MSFYSYRNGESDVCPGRISGGFRKPQLSVSANSSKHIGLRILLPCGLQPYTDQLPQHVY